LVLLQFIVTSTSRGETHADFTKPGYGTLESGVRRLRDGTYEVAGLVRMPGVSAAMYRWWFTDYLNSTEQYRAWHPKDHVWMDWEHKQPGKIVGAHHLVHESMGGEMNRLRIQFVAPEEILGYDPSDADTEAICARVGQLDSNMNFAEMCHVVRNTPWGAEVRSRFWLGVISNREAGVFQSALLDMAANNPITRLIVVKKETALAVLKHCTEEMSYLGDLLPGIYPR
jgi:hypothetical protein